MVARIEPYDMAQVNQTAQQLRSQASGYAFSYIKNGVYRTRLGQEIKNWTDRLVEQFNNQTLSKQEVLKQFERERQNLLEQHQLLGIYGVDTITDAMVRLYSHSDYGSARSLISVAGAMPNNDPLKELSITQPRWENTPNGQNFKLFRYVAQEQIELRLKGLGNSKLSLEERGRIRQDIINRKIIASSKPVMTPVKEEPKPQLSIKERWEKQRLENWNRAYEGNALKKIDTTKKKKVGKPKKEKIDKPIIEQQAGKKGNWNKVLDDPKPNTIYKVECIHGDKKAIYTYETDHLCRTISVKGKLELSPVSSKERDKQFRSKEKQVAYGPAIAGKEGKVREDYHGGHGIGTLFLGPAEKINIVPQLGSQNTGKGKWAAMERRWREKLKLEKSVDVEIKFSYDGDSEVPKKIFGEYKVDGEVKEFNFRN